MLGTSVTPSPVCRSQSPATRQAGCEKPPAVSKPYVRLAMRATLELPSDHPSDTAVKSIYEVAFRTHTRGMRVQFHRGGQPDEYLVLVGRDDGRTARLPGYDGRQAVPHHLVHFVAEHEFHLIHGVFGCIAAGAMFSNMSLVGGRPRYDVPPDRPLRRAA